MSNFHPLEVVDCGSETQFQVGENVFLLFSALKVNITQKLFLILHYFWNATCQISETGFIKIIIHLSVNFQLCILITISQNKSSPLAFEQAYLVKNETSTQC